ncbi:recombinase family protein [Sutcliffiella horikoshii]|uniref:recombinase family protein n=1 Tax=Sutcliffiella horikoshii TaxID=79883 RepID=UPI003CEB94A0
MKNKKTAVYVRTTSNENSVNLQLEAAKGHLMGVDETEIVLFSDMSAKSSSIREGLNELIDSISNDRIDTLIVFNRDRLTRDAEEYKKFIELFYAKNINVIFSGQGALPFNYDRRIETEMASLVDKEREIMSRRIKIAQKDKKILREVNL